MIRPARACERRRGKAYRPHRALRLPFGQSTDMHGVEHGSIQIERVSELGTKDATR